MKRFSFLQTQIKHRPRLKSSLITLILLPIFVYLSLWQFGRYQLKTDWQKTIHHQRYQLPLYWKDIHALLMKDQDLQPLRYQLLEVRGKFLNHSQLFLDNQIHKGKAGYHVLTPFVIKETGVLLLVDRGWVSSKTRDEIPIIPFIDEEILLQGWISFPIKTLKISSTSDTSPLAILSADDFHQNAIFPLRIQTIEFNALSALFQQQVLPIILKLSEESPYSFATETIQLSIQPQRHLGYAIQWLGMAIAVLIYFIVINRNRNHRN